MPKQVTEKEKKPDKKGKVEFWEKLGRLSDDEKSNYEADIERLFPVEDPDTGFPIAGYCGTLPAAHLSKKTILDTYGGGTYKVELREVGTHRYFHRTQVVLPGRPKINLHSNKKQETKPQTQGQGQRQGGRSYQDGYEAATRRNELEELHKAVNSMRDEIRSHGNGNGNGARHGEQEVFSNVISALTQVSSLFGGRGGDLGIKDILAIVKESKEEGRTAAEKMFELVQQNAGGADPTAQAEIKALEIFGDLAKNAQRGGFRKKNATKVDGKDSSAQATRVFVEIRDGMAESIDKELGEAGKTAAQTFRGARTIPDLLNAVDQMLAYMREMLEDMQNAGEDTQENDSDVGDKKPGSPKPDAPTT